jgi:hypothetical protein
MDGADESIKDDGFLIPICATYRKLADGNTDTINRADGLKWSDVNSVLRWF